MKFIAGNTVLSIQAAALIACGCGSVVTGPLVAAPSTNSMPSPAAGTIGDGRPGELAEACWIVISPSLYL